MAELNVPLKSLPAPLALGAVFLVVLLRLFTLSNSDDAALREAISAELMLDLGQRTMQALDQLDRSDPANYAQIAALANPDQIQIHRMRLSKPLLSFSSSQRVIVAVDYSLSADDAIQHEYWAFDHSLIAGWRYRYRSNVVSYYLNFF